MPMKGLQRVYYMPLGAYRLTVCLFLENKVIKTSKNREGFREGRKPLPESQGGGRAGAAPPTDRKSVKTCFKGRGFLGFGRNLGEQASRSFRYSSGTVETTRNN